MSHILIVDDKEENAYYLQALLTSSGHVADSARHGAEALVKARQSPPDLVISDLLMPVMDGYTLLRLWKADDRLKQVPFIVYTATYTEPEDEQLALSLGADAFILKPAEPEVFLARLRQVLENVTGAIPASPKKPSGDEKELLKVYSKTLIRKLEEKTLQLEESNRALQQDIGKRRQVEEELRWKTAFLEAQVDSALDGILVVDTQGQKILQNQRLNEIWKLPRQIIEDKNDAAQIQFCASRTKKPKEFSDKVAYLSSHPDEVSQDEIELVDATILDRYSSPVRDQTGKYYGRIWTFRDITQHRKLEAQYHQSQKMEAFGQLAGGVAHDFNNILAVIQLQAELLKCEQNLSLEQLASASEIEQAAQRATNLTRQLLLFSRQQTMQPHDLNLQDVVANIAKMLKRTLGEHIHLQFKFSPQPLYIHADAGMMDQILLNLTVNARDAMPKGGQIIIETSAVEFDEVTAVQTAQARPGAFVCLSVTDTGSGIRPEILPRIFEPFFTTKEVGKGTGLGLATCFGIAQQHKGWINVYSEIDQGTTFRVYLPQLTTVPDKKTVWSSLASIRGGSETILLVEDESALRTVIQTTLSRLGYRVLEAANGVEALAVWQQNRDAISLLLTDLVLPGGLTGTDLAVQLLEQNQKLKVVYASGYRTEIGAQDFLLEEGINFLTKPFETDKLAQTIRNRLDQI
jgi:signal transduction histidine kinase/CheY-like chemotaxis protein